MFDPVNNAMGLTGKRILIVDDDTVSRIFLRELLVQSGAELDFVRNGYELQKYIGSKPEPDADGVELAAQLLAKKPGLRVVAETAYVIEGLDEKCRDYGLKGCVYKPINKDELLELLLKVVE